MAPSPNDALPLRPKRVENRPTEDDIATERLGGVKGSPELPAAPLTRKEAEQMPASNEPGHTA